MRWRGPVLLGALWAAAAVLATTVGLLSVRMVAGDLGGSVATPLSGEQVRRALPSGTATASPSGRPTPRATRTPAIGATPSGTNDPVAVGAVRTVRTSGGTVGARCEAGAPDLLYATPADGWRTKESSDTRVRFERGEVRVTVRMTCSGSRLRASVTTEDEGASPSPRPSPSETEDHEPNPSPSESEDPDDDSTDDADR